MKLTTPLCAAALAASALPLEAQAIRQVPGHTQSNPLTTFFGSSDELGTGFASVGDWDGDGVGDYAVGAPDAESAIGAPSAGSVTVYSGATGAAFRTTVGLGGIPLCTGGWVSHRLGSAVTAIGDLDGDGLDEILAGEPFRPLSGSCPTPNHGGFRIVYSNGANPDFIHVGTAPTNLGRTVADVGTLTGTQTITFFAVSANDRVQVWSHNGAAGIVPVLQSQMLTQSAGAAIAGVGQPWDPTTSILPSVALQNGETVEVWDPVGIPVTTIAPPSTGIGYGKALAALAPDSPGGDPALVIGAPDANGGAGLVEIVEPDGTRIQITGAAGDGLGSVIASGGDIDADGDQDFVVTAPGGGYVLVADRFGNTAARPITLAGSSGEFGAALGIVPDLNGDGYDDVLVGDPRKGLATPGSSHLFFGGPDAAVLVHGAPCAPVTGTSPALSTSGPPIIGSSISFQLTGASANAWSELFGGIADPVGAPVLGCLFHLFTFPPPIKVFATTTNVNGDWSTASFQVPTSPGARVGYQCFTVAPVTGTPVEFSNGLEIVLGW